MTWLVDITTENCEIYLVGGQAIQLDRLKVIWKIRL